MIEIKSDYTDMFHELDRVESMPTIEMTASLNAALTLGGNMIEGAVHVDTGKLKKSKKQKSRTNKNDWKGEFSFPAKNSKGVSYGIYEIEREGTHNFFSSVFLLKPIFLAALKKGLRK